MQRAARTGLTLIEVMIVVVIIGLLAGFAMPKFNGSRRQAYIAAMRNDLRNLVGIEEVFFSDSARYSSNQASMNYRVSAGDVVSIATGPGYWSATAAHAQIPGFTCGISVNTDNPVTAGVPDGQTECKTAGAAGITGK
ncbi:MAG: putative pilin [Gemmatimonadetes bacterium]|jgi:prepilin-type N-terminal cleavage/methylation domain-containing protein|nr:putative pilin [Gemmatimonadota bacterium]